MHRKRVGKNTSSGKGGIRRVTPVRLRSKKKLARGCRRAGDKMQVMAADGVRVYTTAGVGVGRCWLRSASLLPAGRPMVWALILSCRRIRPSISASGRGGQPGM